MNDPQFTRLYDRHIAAAERILVEDGRERLQRLHDRLCRQIDAFGSASAGGRPKPRGLLGRLLLTGEERNSEASYERLLPKRNAYADVLKADELAMPRVEDIKRRARETKARQGR